MINIINITVINVLLVLGSYSQHLNTVNIVGHYIILWSLAPQILKVKENN